MNLTEYRMSSNELDRTHNLLALVPEHGRVALDVGARDGYFSRLLVQRFDKVIALDITRPAISHPRIECRQGDVTHLDLADNSVDFVFCAEVIEHIPARNLALACQELQRVCSDKLLIGVPYRQDIRVGRTTCYTCLGKNPPWGHVNSFDDDTLTALFNQCVVDKKNFSGWNKEQTNALATLLLDLAGNPYGTYDQEEVCIHCGHRLIPSPQRTLAQRVLTRLGSVARKTTAPFAQPHANWVHVLFDKIPDREAVAHIAVQPNLKYQKDYACTSMVA